ncbi:hypothetical protein BZA70DRAFT_267277 [Myxozyma melibiosi]|uniref:DH domain-containing protein n=1 Tax=Myxozyma melibiosi TaxID=54550 RepID=A0ABR1F6J1_9ASCO
MGRTDKPERMRHAVHSRLGGFLKPTTLTSNLSTTTTPSSPPASSPPFLPNPSASHPSILCCRPMLPPIERLHPLALPENLLPASERPPPPPPRRLSSADSTASNARPVISQRHRTASSPERPSSSLSNFSDSSSGHYYRGPSSARAHRRNLAHIKNSVTANHSAIEPPPPRVSSRKSYVLHDLPALSTKNSPTLSFPDIPLPPPPPERKRDSSAVRFSRSTPDLHALFRAQSKSTDPPSTGDSGLSLTSSTSSSITNGSNNTSAAAATTSTAASIPTLKSKRSFPRLRQLARRAVSSGTSTKRISRSVSPLYRNPEYGLQSNIELVPPLPDKFPRNDASVDTSVSSNASTGDRTPDTPITPSSVILRPSTPVSDNTSVTVSAAPNIDPVATAPDHVSTDNDPESEKQLPALPSPSPPPSPSQSIASPDIFYTPRNSVQRRSLLPEPSQFASHADDLAFTIPPRSQTYDPSFSTHQLPADHMAAQVSARLAQTEPESHDVSRSVSRSTVQTTASAASSTGSSAESKRSYKRVRLIRELIDTEQAYLQDLDVLDKYYRQSASGRSFFSKDDIKVIFGNLSAVIDFTSIFSVSLRTAASVVYSSKSQDSDSVDGSALDERDSFIGETFLQAIPQLEQVYTAYIHNQQLAVNRLHKITSSSSSSYHRWEDSCRKASSSKTNAWSLESLLVKPVQRLLKYPMLLKSLAELTPSSHPDKQALIQAAESIASCADRINEQSRRVHPSASEPDLRGKSSSSRKGLARSTEKLKFTVGRTGSDKSASSSTPQLHHRSTSSVTSIASSQSASTSTTAVAALTPVQTASSSATSTPVINQGPVESVDKNYDAIVDRFRRRHFELRVVIESFAGAVNATTAALNKMYTFGASLEDYARLPESKTVTPPQSPRVGVSSPSLSSRSRSTANLRSAKTTAVPYAHADKFSSFKNSAQEVRDHELPRFRAAVMTHVLSPLEQILDLFDGPINQAMAQRDRRVPDYKRYLHYSERGLTPAKHAIMLANNFKEINSQLVTEIPMFLKMVDDMVRAVTLNWVDILARWNLVYARRIRMHTSKDLERHRGDVSTGSGQSSLATEDIEMTFALRYSKVEQSLAALKCCKPLQLHQTKPAAVQRPGKLR